MREIQFQESRIEPWEGGPGFNDTWTLEDLCKWQDMLKFVSGKLNIIRWQLEQYERIGNGPLADRFDSRRNITHEVWSFMLSLKSSAMKAMLWLWPRTMDELCGLTEAELREQNELLFTDKVITQIKDALAAQGRGLRGSRGAQKNPRTSGAGEAGRG
jgi:hypothetical protein